jgi:hypothetical protein
MVLGALVEDCIACRTTIRDMLLAALDPQKPKGTVKLDALFARGDRPWPAEVMAAKMAPPAPPRLNRRRRLAKS